MASSGFTVAVSVTVSPAFTEAEVLFSVTDVTGVATTVISQVALLSPAFAVIVAVPTFLAVTTPLLTVATVASDVLQVTVLSVASSGFTVAVSVTVSPAFNETEVLLKLISSTTIGSTFTTHEASLFPQVAFMVAWPTLCAVTVPSSTIATESSEEDHLIVLSVVASGRTVAERCTV